MTFSLCQITHTEKKESLPLLKCGDAWIHSGQWYPEFGISSILGIWVKDASVKTRHQEQREEVFSSIYFSEFFIWRKNLQTTEHNQLGRCILSLSCLHSQVLSNIWTACNFTSALQMNWNWIDTIPKQMSQKCDWEKHCGLCFKKNMVRIVQKTFWCL